MYSFFTHIKLRPFQLNRALFFTNTMETAVFYGNKGLQFFDKGIAMTMERWSDEKHRCFNVIASYGGWIAICNLPFNLWNDMPFERIGASYGGLLEVDNKTKNFENLFEARLKVRGSDSEFLPSTIEVTTGVGLITVRVKPLSKPFKRRES